MDTIGWDSLISADFFIGEFLFHQGRMAEALQNARAAVQMQGDHNCGGLELSPAMLWAQIALCDAQRGNPSAAEQALQEGRRSINAYASVNRTPKFISES